MQQQRLCQPELDACTKVPIAKFGDERERLFKECDSAREVVLAPCDEGQPGPVPCLPFEIAQFLRKRESTLEYLCCCRPFAQVEVNFTLGAEEV